MNEVAEAQRSRITFGLLAVVFLGLFLYLGILHAPFVYDDHSAVVDNESIKNLKTSMRDVSNNRYITFLTFALNYGLCGLKPFGYHLINNLIHVINAILVYYLVVLTFKTPWLADSKISAQFVAFSSAFIFVAHPIQTQAVTYIAQRATSMATMFYLLSLVMYIKWRIRQLEDRSQMPEPHAARYVLYAISLISAILAMKSKEIAFTLPIVIILYEFFFFSKSMLSNLNTPNYKRFLYLIPILLTFLIIPLSMLDIRGSMETVTQDIDFYSRETANISRTDYLLTQFRVIMTYLRLLVMPVNQSIDYSFPVFHSFLNPQVFFSFLFILLIVSIGVYLFYRSQFAVLSSQTFESRRLALNCRLISFGIFWFFISLSVESSIIPIKDLAVEHRLYLPSVGFFIVSAILLEHFIPKTKIKIILVIIIVLLLSIGTYCRNMAWKDPLVLWEDVLSKFPANIRAYNGVGVVFKNQGEYNMAIKQFERALKINPNYILAYYNLGDIQYRLGNYKEAIEYFKKALSLRLSYNVHLDTLNSLGMTYSEMGDDENAENTFKEAVKLFPLSVIPYNNLGRQYIKMGKFDLAIEILEKGLEIREEPHLRSNLSTAYAMKAEKEKDSGKTKK